MNNSVPLLEPLFNRSAYLSQREIEVLDLIAAGHASKDAAEILFLSKRTVDSHLSRVYNKLRVSNRIQAVSAARELGMLS